VGQVGHHVSFQQLDRWKSADKYYLTILKLSAQSSKLLVFIQHRYLSNKKEAMAWAALLSVPGVL
jgi:hypothetical protein